MQKTVQAIIDETRVADIINLVLQYGYYEQLRKNYPESWEDRFSSLERLSSYSEKYSSIEAFIESMALEDTLFFEAEENRANDSLTLSTIHSAKGKEWDVVFVLALNEGHFPSTWGNANMEEERRLFYVASSRAARYLHLMTYRYDYKRGNVFATGPSLFLREIPSSRLERFTLSR